MVPPPSKQINLFNQKHPEIQQYDARIYSQNISSCNFGATNKIPIPDENISAIGFVILSLELPQLTVEAGGIANWCNDIGYALIKRAGWKIDSQELMFDKLALQKNLYSVLRSPDMRSQVFYNAGRRSSLCNPSSANIDNVVKESEVLNIYLPFPNALTLCNYLKVDSSRKKHITFIVEFEKCEDLVCHRMDTKVDTKNMSLKNVQVAFETFLYPPTVNFPYSTEMYVKDDSDSTSVTSEDASNIKELLWITTPGIFTEKNHFTFIPSFEATETKVVEEYVSSIIEDLICIADSLESLKDENPTAHFVEVVNNQVVVDNKPISVLIKGIPKNKKLYYNTDILIYSSPKSASTIELNISSMFDLILGEYYEELDIYVFSKIQHSLTINEASLPVKHWIVNQNRVSGDNRSTKRKTLDFVYIDHFRLGYSFAQNDACSIKSTTIRAANSEIYKDEVGLTNLYGMLRYNCYLPAYMNIYTFTGTPHMGVPSTSFNIPKEKQIKMTIEPQKHSTEKKPVSTLYTVCYGQL